MTSGSGVVGAKRLAKRGGQDARKVLCGKRCGARACRCREAQQRAARNQVWREGMS